MNQDYQILKQDLRMLGLKKGDAVLIHSSYKSMGGLEGGIETFIDAVMSVIGDRGTLLTPTLTFRDVTEANPVFDYANTPSCVGAISEFVRNIEDARRSIHPTHSCTCYGFKQDWYAQDHENDCTPVGKNSPIYKLHEDGGKILMLGCKIGSNTSMHGVEECLPTSYVLPETPSPYTIILPDKTYDIEFYRHHIHQNGYAQRYDRLENVLDPMYMPKRTVHGAVSWLIDAPAMWKTALETLKKDEFYFVDRITE